VGVGPPAAPATRSPGALVAADPRSAGWAARALAVRGDAAGAGAPGPRGDRSRARPDLRRAEALDHAGAAAIAAWTEVLDRAGDDTAARAALAAARLRAGDRAGCAHELTALPATATTDPAVARLRADCAR
jgi:hypothetical protein